MHMRIRDLFDKIHRDPADFPLFCQVYQVLQFAPSGRHADDESLVSLAVDALDYLKANGRWTTASPTGRTEMTLDGHLLHVHEDDDRDFTFDRTYDLRHPAMPVEEA